MNIALIFAGGVGKRMNLNGLPKQFLLVNNKPILIHTLEKFQNNSNIDKIILVSVSSHINFCKDLIDKYKISKITKIVEGGFTGQESIFNGLNTLRNEASSNDIVLIHDGVRPVINNKLIDDNIESVKIYGNAISCSPAIETIAMFSNNVITNIVPRDKCIIAKAPQSFYYQDIISVHDKARQENYLEAIDSASLMSHYGHELHYVNCSPMNIKITTPSDYYIFKGLLESENTLEILGLI